MRTIQPTHQKDIVVLQNKMELINWPNPDETPFLIRCHSKYIHGQTVSHWHDELELTCMFDGRADFYTGGVCRMIEAPGVVITNPGVIHNVVTRMEGYNSKMSGEFGGISVLIHQKILNALIPDYNDIYFKLDSRGTELELVDWLTKVYRLYIEEDTVSNKLRILAALGETVAILYEKCRKNHSPEQHAKERDRERTKIIISYLNSHYSENLKQEDLAEHFHYTREYFSRLFKSQTGMSYKDYITQYRLERAKFDLETTSKTILEVAERNGFGSETQFISWFRRIYGLTPAKYRQAVTQ